LDSFLFFQNSRYEQVRAYTFSWSAMVMSRLSFVVLMLAVTLPHGRAVTFNVDPAKVLLRFSLHAARLPLS